MPLTRLIQSHPSDARHRMMRLRAFYTSRTADGYEHLYSAMKVILGVWLLLPLHTFASAPRSYRLVAAFAPEWAWGLFWCAAGAGQFLSWYYDWRPARFWVNSLGAFLWGGYGVLLVIGDPRSPALAFFAPMAAYQTLAAAWLAGRYSPDPAVPPAEGVSPSEVSPPDVAPLSNSAPTPRPPAGRSNHDGEG